MPGRILEEAEGTSRNRAMILIPEVLPLAENSRMGRPWAWSEVRKKDIDDNDLEIGNLADVVAAL